MKKRILALLLSLSLMVSVVVPGTVAMDGGDTVDDTYTELAVNDRKTLHASQFGISAEPYQWQISIGGTWINISGETSDSITVSYAMLCNALSDGTAQVRCVGYDSEGMLIEPDAMTIRITEKVTPTPVEQEETHPAGTVLEQAKPLGDPIIEKIEGESEDIKDQIKEKFDEFKDNAKDALDQIKDSAKEKLEELKNKIDEKNDPEPIDQTEETSAETTVPAETTAEPASTDDSAATDDSVVTGGSELTNVETDTAPTTDEDAGDDDVSDQTEMTETTGEAEPEKPAESEDKTPAAEEPADTTTEQEVTTSAPETEAPVTEAPETDALVATEPSEGSDEDQTEDIVISAPSFASPLTDEESSAENKENDTQTPPPAPAEQTPPTSPSDPVTPAAPEKQEEQTGNTENTDEDQKASENTERKDVPSDEQNNVPTVTDSANAVPASDPATADNEEPNKDGENVQENDTPAGETTEPTTYTILINYQFADGTPVTDPWSSDAVETGYSYKREIKSPVVAGFTPDQETVSVDASEGVTYTVTYQPVELEFTVTHWQQNVSNDEYTEFETETRKCVYSDVITDIGKTYEGFFTIPCGEQTISKDGTVINVYYDRYYYLITYPLADGTGEGKVYARFGEEITVESSFDELYEKLMAAETADEVEAILVELTDEVLAAFQSWLEENGKLEELQAHFESLMPEGDPVEEPIVSFTDAGPLLSAPVVRRARAVRAASENGTDSGVVLNKSATLVEGGYTITLEAYATGQSTTTVSTEPVDIVLVLDVSGSMDDSLTVEYRTVYESQLDKNKTYYVRGEDGNYFSVTWYNKHSSWGYQHYLDVGGWFIDKYDPKSDENDSNSDHVQFYERYVPKKIDSLKSAVNSFIDSVNEKSPDSKIAIVKFAGEKINTIGNDTYRDGRYTYNYSQIVKELTLASEDVALKGAINSLNPAGATAADYGMEHAQSIIERAKDDGHKKVVIMFTDGEPNHHSGFDSDVANSAISASKSIKDANATVYTIGVFGGADGTPVNNLDGISNTNKYMHLVSSNYKNATDMRNTGNSTYPESGKSYFLSAGSQEDLMSIFNQISSEVGGSTVTLDSTSYIQDTVSEQFEIPEGTDRVQFYTMDCVGENQFDENTKKPAEKVTYNIEGKTLKVTGFDFSANWCGSHSGTYSGKKLIVEFTVKERDGFLGGNGVPTNVGTSDGIFNSTGTSFGIFVSPTVNVPIKDVTVTPQDKNVYLLGEITSEQLKSGATVKVGDVQLDLSKANSNYGLESWQTDYVNIKVTVKDGDTVITDKLSDLMDNKTYTIEVTVSPKTGEGEKSGCNSAKINVFKPELTFKDSEAKYGEKVPDDFNANKVGEEKWKHNSVESGPILGTKPTLDITYSPDEETFDKENNKYTNQDVPVKVTVKIGNTDVTEHTTFDHQQCGLDCDWDVLSTGRDIAFKVHITTCSLTITKTGRELIDEKQSFIFNVKGKDNNIDLDVVIAIEDNEKSGSITINDLPIGEYKVTEKTSWSWRYTPEGGAEKSVDLSNTDRITFTNTREKTLWLNGCAYAPNKFGSPIINN